MWDYIKIIVVVTFCFCYSIQSDLPSDFQKCNRSDDDFNGCLKVAIQDALVKFENGIPDLGFPSLQPVMVKEATIGEGATGAVRVVQRYFDIKLYNFTRTKIDSVEAVITDTEFKLTITGILPDFVWNSDYDFNGRILVLPITGHGKLFAGANRVKVGLICIGEIYEKSKEKYIKISSVKLDFNPYDFRVNFENLFNGDKRLGEEMNKVLNSNWRELWADTKPSYETLFETILLASINRLFKKIPLNSLFPI